MLKRGRWNRAELDAVARYAHCTRTTRENCMDSLFKSFGRNPECIGKKYDEALLKPAPPMLKAKEKRLLAEMDEHGIVIRIWWEE